MTEEHINVYGEDTEFASLDEAIEIRLGSVSGDEIGAVAVDGDSEIVSLLDADTINVLSVEGDELHLMSEGSPGDGTKDYNRLINKPKIEGVTLEGDKTYEELNLRGLTNSELEAILHL